MLLVLTLITATNRKNIDYRKGKRNENWVENEWVNLIKNCIFEI
jgi:hypothetical protein